MYIIFQVGSKQYRISKGQIIRLEKIDTSVGKIIEFTKVLMIISNQNIEIGTPFIKDCVIKAEVITHGYDEKLKIIKFRRRKHYRKQQGHRQLFTNVRIVDISI